MSMRGASGNALVGLQFLLAMNPFYARRHPGGSWCGVAHLVAQHDSAHAVVHPHPHRPHHPGAAPRSQILVKHADTLHFY